MKPLRSLLATALLAALPTLALAQATPAARKLAHDAVIVDTHIDAPEMIEEGGWRDLGQRTDREFDWPKAQQGGLKVAFMSIYTSPEQDATDRAYQVANTMIDSIEALVQRHPDKFALLRSPRDVARRKPGVVLLPFGMENGAPIGSDIRRLQFFYNRGVRYITLAHSAANRIADSSYGVERKWHGLSPFGRDVVKEMNHLGIMVDVSHLSDESALEAIKLSRVPVIASHSGMRHFTPGFERNASDEIARAIAAKGGVVQLTFGTGFVNPTAAANLQGVTRALTELRAAKAAGKPVEDEAAFIARFDREHPTPPTDISAVLDQVAYAVKLIGADHVGIGSDFDGVDGKLPAHLKNVADYPNFVAGLQARGIKDADIRKILGGNLLRVWTAVENGARH